MSDDEAAPSRRCRRCRWEGEAAVAAACDDVGVKQPNKPVYRALGNPTRGKVTSQK